MPTEGSVAEVIAASGLSAFTVFDVLHRLVRRGLVQAVLEDAAIP
jgi:DNA-binding IclR family transcriptional regulator